jgi:hypothetical protein
LYKSAARGLGVADDRDAPNGVRLEHEAVLDASAFDGGHPALAIKRVGDGERHLQRVALAASRRTDDGFVARYTDIVVEHLRQIGGVDAAAVVGDRDAVGSDGDGNLGRDAVILAIVDAVVGKLLGDHQRPVVGAMACCRRQGIDRRVFGKAGRDMQLAPKARRFWCRTTVSHWGGTR